MSAEEVPGDDRTVKTWQHQMTGSIEVTVLDVDCGPDGRRPGSADAVDLTEFEVGPREVICAKCWLVHRPGVDCES